jgi:hypothetical protein
MTGTRRRPDFFTAYSPWMSPNDGKRSAPVRHAWWRAACALPCLTWEFGRTA